MSPQIRHHSYIHPYTPPTSFQSLYLYYLRFLITCSNFINILLPLFLFLSLYTFSYLIFVAVFLLGFFTEKDTFSTPFKAILKIYISPPPHSIVFPRSNFICVILPRPFVHHYQIVQLCMFIF